MVMPLPTDTIYADLTGGGLAKKPSKSEIRTWAKRALLYADTVAEMQSIPSTTIQDGTVYYLKQSDGGKAGVWEWDATAPATLVHDGRSCIVPSDSAGAGRWLRVDAEDFIVYCIGQSNAAQSDAKVVSAPVGGYPSSVRPLAGTFTRVNAGAVDNLTISGPATLSSGLTFYDPTTTSIISAAAALAGPLYDTFNNLGVGTAMALHEKTDNPVTVVNVAIGSHPIERFDEIRVAQITNVTLAGSVVTIHVDDIRWFQNEALSPGQLVDLVAPAGMPALSGRFRVNDRTPAWTTTRSSASPVAGTLKLYTEANVAFNGTGLPAYTSGGQIKISHLWTDLKAAITQMATLKPNAKSFIVMSQSEANGGALDGADLFTTVGGYTRDFAKARERLITQFEAIDATANAVIAFEEAARVDANGPEKPRNLDFAESVGLAPNVTGYSTKGFAMANGDDSHFADHFGIGYFAAGPALYNISTIGKTDTPDIASIRYGRLRNNMLGFRHGVLISMDETVYEFGGDRMRGREDWNNQGFYSRSSRIKLNVDDMTAANLMFGGGFRVTQWSITGNTPNGSGGTDATAAGRTSIVAAGFTFIDTFNAAETSGIYYITGNKKVVDFHLASATQIFVIRNS